MEGRARASHPPCLSLDPEDASWGDAEWPRGAGAWACVSSRPGAGSGRRPRPCSRPLVQITRSPGALSVRVLYPGLKLVTLTKLRGLSETLSPLGALEKLHLIPPNVG